jgi:hypothetical protein
MSPACYVTLDAGSLPDRRSFQDVRELKRLLLKHDVKLRPT